MNLELTVEKEKKKYQHSWQDQAEALIRCKESGTSTLIVLEHDPVVTYGSDFNPKKDRKITDAKVSNWHNHNYPDGPEIDFVYDVGRKGSVTFHGHGQLVAYLITDLAHVGGVVSYVNFLEDAVAWFLDDYGIFDVQKPKDRNHPGAIVEGKKIASVGIGFSRSEDKTKSYVWHGLALNVNTDLQYFDQIYACGEKERRFTSMRELLGEKHGGTLDKKMMQKFANDFRTYLATQFEAFR